LASGANPTGPNATGFTILLPAPTGNIDKEVAVKNVSDISVSVFITSVDGCDIDGSTGYIMNIPRQAVMFHSIGTGYIIV
jgi:hypothetical protein